MVRAAFFFRFLGIGFSQGEAEGRRISDPLADPRQKIFLLFQQLLYCRNMEKTTALAVFESLSSGIRLDIYRLLVRKGPDGMVAGDISASMALPPSNLSFHLKALTQAGLLAVEQEGRFQRYRANMPLMLEVIDYLTAECCAGHPEQCLNLPSPCLPAGAPTSTEGDQ
jgi:DNA-binding transcriptional ArsR family regulator